MRPTTKMLFVETPTNPVMRLTDIARPRATIAHSRNVRLVVDNTFASPVVQRPIALGADLVVHSTTKYLNGHSDSVGGVVVAARDDDVEWLRVHSERGRRDPQPVRLVAGAARHQDAGGADGAAQRQRPGARASSWRRIRRCARCSTRAPTHPQHELAKRQMQGFGGMLSFDVGDFEAARRVLQLASG